MKIYISADIEGIVGICHWDETTSNGSDYGYFRTLMTNEVVACCQALNDLGITDIYVRDAHDSARNIDFTKLPRGVKIIREWSGGICSMMDGLDESFDGVIYIGYHSPARSNGNPLSHTQNTQHVYININDQNVSEYLLNTYYAQTKKVPVIMISGDETICQIASNENNNTSVVPTKRGLHGAVISHHVEDVIEQIKKQTAAAIKKLNTLPKEAFFVKIPPLLNTSILFKNHVRAYRASFYPNTKLLQDDTICHTTDNVIEMLKFIMFCD